jgi:hypothetical protein
MKDIEFSYNKKRIKREAQIPYLDLQIRSTPKNEIEKIKYSEGEMKKIRKNMRLTSLQNLCREKSEFSWMREVALHEVWLAKTKLKEKNFCKNQH